MFRNRLFGAVMAMLLLAALPLTVSAAEVECDGVYCFGAADFAEDDLSGICITGSCGREIS